MSVHRKNRIRSEINADHASVAEGGESLNSVREESNYNSSEFGVSDAPGRSVADFGSGFAGPSGIVDRGQTAALETLLSTLEQNTQQVIGCLNRLIALNGPFAAELRAATARIAELEGQIRNLASGNGS